jgi:hypothetical protein
MAGDVKTKMETMFRDFSRASRVSSRGTDAVSGPVASPLKADVPDAGVFILLLIPFVNNVVL